MCVILDVNRLSDFQNQSNTDMEPMRKWFLKMNSKFVHSHTEKFQKDWKGETKKRLLRKWKQAGKLRIVGKEKVEEETLKLEGKIKSNDPHIIALARIAKVKVLVSKDGDLQKDFKNRDLVSHGSLYKVAQHKHLLRPDICP